MPNIEVIAAMLFAIALVHTFSTKFFERLANQHPRHAGLFHLLGEVEVVFGFWAVVLVALMAFVVGGSQAIEYAESRKYTEPLFVFVIMVVAASRPVVEVIAALVAFLARLAPVRFAVAQVWLCLAMVPLIVRRMCATHARVRSTNQQCRPPATHCFVGMRMPLSGRR